ncbi:hypothetical protein K438DRAFT_1786516 [Mycena galopus ATCC 62051]|nr:hypothetical protein K438DRAFT_1786516 [Mycena galopus ATCC 62051]
MPKREKHSPVPPLPSQSVPAIQLVWNKYHESHKKKKPEKWNSDGLKRKEISTKKGRAKKDIPQEKRDYNPEDAVWTCRRWDELQEKVADTLWMDKDRYMMYDGQ